jgi:hypothetical protein
MAIILMRLLGSRIFNNLFNRIISGSLFRGPFFVFRRRINPAQPLSCLIPHTGEGGTADLFGRKAEASTTLIEVLRTKGNHLKAAYKPQEHHYAIAICGYISKLQ